MRDDIAVKKERELKDDGRYIIFYAFEEDDDGEAPAGEEEG